MKISELAGEGWPRKTNINQFHAGEECERSFAEGRNGAIGACDLTVVVDVEAMAKIISEIAFHKYKPNGEAYLESRPKEVAQYLSQSAKQFIKIVKE